jgi:aminoglycoside phosphotransferase (APT) family kinase protein
VTEQKTEKSAVLSDNVRNAQATWFKLDVERLQSFIESQPDVIGPLQNANLEYPSSGQGISNGIAFLSADIDTGDGLSHRDMVVRYAPGTTLLKQKSFEDEFLTMQAISETEVPAPKAWWLDATGDGLGAPGYIMDRVYGDIPGASMFTDGLLAECSPKERKSLMLEAVGFHGRLRRCSLGPEAVPHLANRGVGNTTTEKELNWWMEEARQNLAEGNDKRNRIQGAWHWLLSHQPKLRPATLVHGDAQLCNLIYRDGKVFSAIDWELAYLGQGEVDLAMIVWLTRLQAMAVPALQGIPTEEEFITHFEKESGAAVEHYNYMKLMQLFKLVSVLTASANTMPGFDEFWEINWAELEKVWQQCRLEYGD